MKDKKLRQCTYPNCDRQQYTLIKKMCSYHYAKSKPQKIYKYKLKNKPQRSDKKQRSDKLKIFFKYHINKLQNGIHYCENCGVRLTGQIANVAHIFPKRNNVCPEIMDNLDNYMYLCCSLYGEPGCHELYDRIQTTSKIYSIPCFKIAYERYKKIIDSGVDLPYNKYTKQFLEYNDE